LNRRLRGLRGFKNKKVKHNQIKIIRVMASFADEARDSARFNPVSIALKVEAA
jgi:hypothetical protein